VSFAHAVIAAAIGLAAYAFVAYPLLLALLARVRGPGVPEVGDPHPWPTVTISLPAYNEERQIRGALDALLALDYPAERRRVLVVSDGSTDGTDGIVAAYADRGVELIALAERRGKTAAEAAAAGAIDTDLVLNTDASIRLHPASLKALVRALEDPTVGVASGRDVSVGDGDADDANEGERGYVGYEMTVRALETRVGGIVGASGSCYAILASLHRLPLACDLSRDFAAALRAREHGYRAVSVDGALCAVPRSSSLRREYRRKVRTMVRGMRTLAAHGGLLNPFRHGLFAWMLWSHKVARWALPWAALAAIGALVVLGPHAAWARAGVVAAGALPVAAAVAWWRDGRVPRVLGLPAWAVLGTVAAIHAAVRALGAGQSAIWEPTRRDAAPTAEAT
jgi:GT2 family glycosyltransferase